MASPPEFDVLWRMELAYAYSEAQSARSSLWYQGPSQPARADVLAVALSVGDAWFGETSLGIRNTTPFTVRPAVRATAWHGWGQPPVIATSDGWAGLSHATRASSLALCAELGVDLAEVPGSFGRRRSHGSVRFPFVDETLVSGAAGMTLSAIAISDTNAGLATMLGQAQVIHDPSGGIWQWVVPLRRHPPDAGTLWVLAPVLSARVRPRVAVQRSRSTTLEVAG